MLKQLERSLVNMDATDQARLVRAGEVTALELVDAAISRIERLEPELNALCGTDFEAARQRAKEPLSGPFAGVPFLIKDLAAYPGLPHAMGSRLMARNVPAEHTPYSTKVDQAGLVVLGKTTISELGLLGSTETLLHGVTHNPWNPERSAGGSSGGSAAAVAARLVPFAHASDGGGSIRGPAAFNGVFGFKPGARQVAESGPADMYGLLVDHCVSWSVRDSAKLLTITTRDGVAIPLVEGPSPERLRIGYYTSTLMGQPPSDSARRALEETVALCRSLGHELVETGPPPVDGQQVSDAFFTLAGAAMVQLAEMVSPMLGRPPAQSELEPFTLELIEWFKQQQPGAADQALANIQEMGPRFAGYLKGFDAILCPTLPMDVPELGFLEQGQGRAQILRKTERIAGYTAVHNMADVPAMSLPLHQSSDGLPIGVHFASARGRETTLLGLAFELEQAMPWRDRMPPRCA